MDVVTLDTNVTEVFATTTARATGFTVNVANGSVIYVEITPPLCTADPAHEFDEQGLKVVANLLRSVSDQLSP